MVVIVDKTEVKCTRFVEVKLSGIKFRISESVDGKLKVNKVVLDFDNRNLKEGIQIFPIATNQIELR